MCYFDPFLFARLFPKMSPSVEFPALLFIDLIYQYVFGIVRYCKVNSIVYSSIPNMAPMYLFAAYIDPIFTGGRAVEDPEPDGGHFSRNGYHILKPNSSLK